MQLEINFPGKKDNSISFRATDDLKNDLDRVRKALNRDSISDLVQEYVIECVFRDLGKISLLKSRGDRRFVSMDKV